MKEHREPASAQPRSEPLAPAPPVTRALGPTTILALQRTAGNAAVTRVLARSPAHPLDLQIRAAQALQGQQDPAYTRDRARYALTRGWEGNREGLLGMERVMDAVIANRPNKAGYGAIMSAGQRESVDTRLRMLGWVASRGVRAGLDYAQQLATTPDASVQLILVRKDIKIVQEQFADRVRTNVHLLLDQSQQRIEAVLKTYGLATAAASSLVDRVVMGSGELDAAVDDWIKRARSRDGYSAPKAAGARGDLVKRTDQLRVLQKRVVELQAEYTKRFDEAPLDEHERRQKDHGRYLASKTPLPPVPDISPQAKQLERQINLARRTLTTAWIEVERLHPILAAHRGREGRHLEWVDLGGYGEPFEFGASTDDKVRFRIQVAEHRQSATPAADAPERAALRQAVRKLANIQRARLGIAQKVISPLKLAPVVRFTENQLMIAPGSAWAAAVREVVEPEKGVLGKGLEFVKDIFDFALLVLSALPTPAAPAATLWEVGRNAFVALDQYVKNDILQTLSNTDLDVARSLSDKVPSLTGFVNALLATGLALAQVKAAFELAAAARRKALQGLSEGWEQLDELGRLHNVPGLGDDVARAEGMAGKGGKSKVEEALERAAQKRKGAGHEPQTGGGRGRAEPEPTAPPHETKVDTTARDKNPGRAKREHHSAEAELQAGLKRGFKRLKQIEAAATDPPLIDDVLAWLKKHDKPFYKRVKRYYKAIGNRRWVRKQMVFLWNSARKNKRTVAEELEHLLTRGEKVTEFRNTPNLGGTAGTEEFRQAIAKPGPLLDRSFASDIHGSHIHMFHEFLGDRLFNSVGAGRTFRLDLANYSLGPGTTILKGTQREYVQPFWSRVWNALFDEGKRGLHKSEDLSDILQTHLDFPEGM